MDDNLSILIKAILDENDIKQDIKDLDKIAEKYTLNFKASIDKGELTNSIKALLPKIIADINKTYGLKLPIDVDDKILDKSINQYQSAMKKMTSEVDKIQLSIADKSYETDIAKITKGFTALSGDANEAKKHVKDLQNAYQQMVDATDDNGRLIAEQKYQQVLAKTKNELTIAQVEAKEYVDTFKIRKLRNDIQDWLKKNTAATEEAKAEMQSYLKMLESGKVSPIDFNTIKSGFDDWDTAMRQANKLGASFTDTLKQGVQKFTEWGLASGAVMTGVSEFKEGIQFVKELDDALTDVAYTSNVSQKQLEYLGNSAIDMAKDLNTSAENILEAVKIYSTANATAEDILRKSKSAIMLSNISGMSGSESSKTINTSLNQFEIEDTEDNLLDIVDTLQYVSSQLNFDFTEGIKEITEGIEASGSVAKNAGLNLQEYATMVGVAVEKTGQSGSTIGNAYKTIFSRITKASATEGTLEEDISAAEKSLRSIGIEVRNSADDFEDLSNTMSDIGEKWDSLTDVQKAKLGYDIAGTRQLNILNSLFGSWEHYSSIMEDIDERTGETLKNQEIYAESVKGHLGELEATSQSVWSNLIESKTIKSGIDLLNGLLTVLDKTTSALGEFGTISTIGSGIIGAKGLGLTNYVTQS